MVWTTRSTPQWSKRARVASRFSVVVVAAGLLHACTETNEGDARLAGMAASASSSTSSTAVASPSLQLETDDVVVTTIRTMDGADPCAVLAPDRVQEAAGEGASPIVRIEKTCEYHGSKGSILVNFGVKVSFLRLVGEYPEGEAVTVVGNSAWQVLELSHCWVSVAISPDPTALVFNVDVGELRPGGGMDTCGMAFELAELIVPVLPQV